MMAVMVAGAVPLRTTLAQSVADAQTLTAEPFTALLMGKDNPPTELLHFRTGGGMPILRGRQGQPFMLQVHNTLGEDIWLHFFGVRGPSDMMTVLVPAAPGPPVDIAFAPPDAGTFWFGPLFDASRKRDMGLTGLLIVDEAEALAEFADIPIILDDWIIDDQGKLDTDFGNLNAAIGDGRMGNWFTVNGVFKPFILVDRSKNNRLRIANVANTRTFTLQFKNSDLNVLALDGQPVPMRGLGLEPVVLAPGQRIDLLLVDPRDQVVISLDLFEDVAEAAFLTVTGKPAGNLAGNFSLPPNPIAMPGDLATARVIDIKLEGGAKGGLKSARVGDEVLELRQLLERGLAWAMNGVAGGGNGPPLFEAKRNETLVLTIDNQTSFAQPLHIHGHVWRLVAADGVAIADAPWRDTCVIPGQSQVQLVLVADNPGTWVLQSLIAERSDAGLIGGFTVVDMP